ncbi:hypothetical protein C482_08411 [Natrialba chahannaoensis JCM 10990]|uniref:Small CPxCG-related zinc finger protein n=1 Tax=Natrialba chahannaoensis JCM 10990 TaxID=1227492 RepID=M0AV00_9EURY|nr:hypothetical protein [Natrialba chahannaoensis]ELZ01204.1 hypothetical protein C482_08411 [Natrialba chahannaoensis JCM 10990]
MSLDRLLPSFLQRERTGDRSPADADGVVLHECRHCGSKFEEYPKTCPVCGSTEIATYQFESDDADDEHETGDSEDVDVASDTAGTDTNGDTDGVTHTKGTEQKNTGAGDRDQPTGDSGTNTDTHGAEDDTSRE